MQIIFLGTRGGIKIKSKIHYNHSAILIKNKKTKIMIDCGSDYLQLVKKINPTAILLTHAHEDHAGGLKNIKDIPVYATQDTLNKLKKFKIRNANLITSEKSFFISDVIITPFNVEHSLIAPACGFRIEIGENKFFYVPDLVKIYNARKALNGIQFYIGDGARISRSLIRLRDRYKMGHASIVKQIEFCKNEGVENFIFTHCGSEIVKQTKEKINEKIMELELKFNVKIKIAYDGMKFTL